MNHTIEIQDSAGEDAFLLIQDIKTVQKKDSSTGTDDPTFSIILTTTPDVWTFVWKTKLERDDNYDYIKNEIEQYHSALSRHV